MSVKEKRQREIDRALERIRDIDRRAGITEASLEEIKSVLLSLAESREMFSDVDFPPPDRDGTSNFYGLSVDADDRYALYLSVGRKGRETPPHDHTTWAVIVGMSGEEENRIYRRADDGRTPGCCALELREKCVLRAGDGLAYMPDAIHSIHVISDEPTRHFHIYGKALAALPDRMQFDMANGTHKHFPAVPAIATA